MPYCRYLAEADLLDPENPYELKETGQGLNRMQQAATPPVLAAWCRDA